MTVAHLTPPGGPDPQIEEWLRAHGVTEFHFEPRLKITEIDVEASLRNQARLQAIDEDHALVIGEAISQGKPMPPIVVYKMGKGFKIIDGNHRVEGYRANDIATCSAYVITQELTETQERLMIADANTRHGLPNTMAERIQYAVWLVEHRAMTQAKAAELVGVPARIVSTRLTAINADRRLTSIVGARTVSRLVGASRSRLGAIQSDVVLGEAAKLASDVRLPTTEVSALVRDVNRARSEADQLAVIEAARAEIKAREDATANNKVPVAKPVASLNRLATLILNFDIDALKDVEVDQKVTKQLRLRVAEAQTKLAEMASAL